MLKDDPLSALLRQLQFSARVIFRDGYCGGWAVDTSGTQQIPFHLVCQGEGWLHGDTERPQRLLAGQLVFFPQDSSHVLAASAEPPAQTTINAPPPARLEGNITRLVCGYFEFDQRAAAPLLSALPATMILDLSRVDDPSTRELVNLWMREAAADNIGSNLAVDRLAELIFVQMLRHEIAGGALRGVLGALGDTHLGPVLAAIHAHPGSAHTQTKMAEAAGMSESNFNKKFKVATGMTPGAYVRHWRMQAAASALRDTRRSMADIASEIGYESEVAFRKAFSTHFKVAPGTYRRRAREPS